MHNNTKRKIDSTLYSSGTYKMTSDFDYSSREYQPPQEIAKTDYIEIIQRDIRYVTECNLI